MTSRRLLSFVSPLTFATLAAVACSSSDDGSGTPPQSKYTFQENGLYRYVLGIDKDTGRFKTGGAHEVVVFTDREKGDKIDSANMPSRLHPKLGDPAYMKYDNTMTAGESDWQVFASTWWAQSNNGISKRWTGGSADLNDITDTANLSPTEKYDLLFNPGQQKQVATVKHWNYRELLKKEDERGEKHEHPAVTVAGPATKWELENHGLYQDYAHPDSWWGHCNGWSSYATTEEGGFPTRDITVKMTTEGKLVDCEAAGDTTGCITFRMGDIEAFFTELYFSDKATFAGRRCKTDPDKIERDEYGRPKDAACRDLNPGSWHIGVTGLLTRGAEHLKTKKMGKPAFVIDHNWDWEVWNFPLVKYEVLEQQEVTKEDAAKLVGAQEYVFNEDARKFVRIKMKYWMVSDGVNDSKMLLRADQRGVTPHETELNYVLELDDTDKILGGEWIKDPETTWGEDNKQLHPDFYWMAADVTGYGEGQDDTGGSDDNPYISYTKAKLLLSCSTDPATCAPPPPPDAGPADAGPADSGPADSGTGPQPGPDSCVNVCGSQASGGCWCDDQCSKYNDCCANYTEACSSAPTQPDAAAPEPDPNSCAGYCGKKAPGGCWCDSSCDQYGDCCTDKAQTCS